MAVCSSHVQPLPCVGMGALLRARPWNTFVFTQFNAFSLAACPHCVCVWLPALACRFTYIPCKEKKRRFQNLVTCYKRSMSHLKAWYSRNAAIQSAAQACFVLTSDQ